MLKKSFLPHTAKNEQMALQITSMADIFVIILVFLLKSYSVEGLPYEPSVALNPPTAKGRVEKTEALKVEIAKSAVNLGGKNVASMDAFKFGKKDIDSDGASSTLRRALAGARSSALSGPKGAKLIVVADEGAPYETIKAVLASAASEGYLDIQLAVAHAQ
jgi:biopolymer transport protein ExbD